MKVRNVLWGILAYSLLCSQFAWSRITREFDAVVVTNEQDGTAPVMADVNNINSSLIVLYKYDSGTGQWSLIPFQIDNFPYFEDTDTIFDTNDEILFMAKDCGDLAPPESWINDASSANYKRYQITVIDNVAGTTGYVYVYRTDNPPVLDNTGLQYDATTDKITSTNYIMEHPDALGGNLGGLTIPVAAGGSGINFLERLKIRVGALIDFFIFKDVPIVITEDSITKNAPTQVNKTQAPIRIVRRWFIKISVEGVGDVSETKFDLKYYRHFVDFGENTIPLDAVKQYGDVKYARYSFDLLPYAYGMRMHTPGSAAVHPDGVFINSSADAAFDRTLQLDQWNWWMQTGAPGTLLSFSLIPDVPSSTEALYYHDAVSGTDDANTWDDAGGDTGTGGSWGDTGAKYEGTIEGELPLGFQLYFLGANITPDSAANILDCVQNPLTSLISGESIYVPVELAGFTGRSYDGYIDLSWTTITETNNLGFDVERRSAQNEAWQKIGFINGYGTTNEEHLYSLIDHPQTSGQYEYRLRQINFDGTFEYSNVIQITLEAPETFVLCQNYPNPFNPSTKIDFELPSFAEGNVKLVIYDLLGKHIRTLVDEPAKSGYYHIEWDGNDDLGFPVGSGVYLFSLINNNHRFTKKMVKIL